MITRNEIERLRSMSPCFCIGPQNGQPLCPCRMRNVKNVDGRWVEIIDHGAVTENVNDIVEWQKWRDEVCK